MSVLMYPPESDEELFRHCKKECGIIASTDDLQYFALVCNFCKEKFMFFDVFISHIHNHHADKSLQAMGSYAGNDCMYNNNATAPTQQALNGGCSVSMDSAAAATGVSDLNAIDDVIAGFDIDDEDLSNTDPSLLEPQMVMIKEEPSDDMPLITGLPNTHEINDLANGLYNPHMKQEQSMNMDLSSSLDLSDNSFLNESYGSYDDFGSKAMPAEDDGAAVYAGEDDDDDANYDDLVEESLLGGPELTMHIKDRKMIQFLIDAYRTRSFLWDHRNQQFRDRARRQQFLEWIIAEFKRRYNLSLAKDAVTRKWDNLRTVYKREVNRMSLEKTNISTLWYFKELSFLSGLYGGKPYVHNDTVVRETIYRRRHSALWNDISTGKLLSLVKQHPCFYDKYCLDYRSKEKRGEALSKMALELQSTVDVSSIQISKRISQLRFDYSKQKYERLQCEQQNKTFVSSYTYYDQMHYMDDDIAPFKCSFCTGILQTTRDLEIHMLQHPAAAALSAAASAASTTSSATTSTANANYLICTLCDMSFADETLFQQHKMLHLSASGAGAQLDIPPMPSLPLSSPSPPLRHQCDLCTASFREKSNYEEHMRRHNDELLLPALAHTVPGNDIGALTRGEKPFVCELCGKAFAHASYLSAHRALHVRDNILKCEYVNCGKVFSTRLCLQDHMRTHYAEDDYKCNVCGKGFRSTKNLQNHRQIHDAIKRYVCKICGSAFAQAAGLYLHKRRHNRPNSRVRLSH